VANPEKPNGKSSKQKNADSGTALHVNCYVGVLHHADVIFLPVFSEAHLPTSLEAYASNSLLPYQ
jgi:hypothetical protein